MLQKRVMKMLAEIALKHNKPLYVIEEIFLSQFKLVRDTVKTEEFPVIKLIGFGKFIPSKEKLNRYKEKKLNEELNGGYPAENNKGTTL